ncbi:MAG: hypothetical protein JWQ24_844 [Tardiphaga sp.]|nr:hypothetical protein [Tardiphaga sp.]
MVVIAAGVAAVIVYFALGLWVWGRILHRPLACKR